MREIILGDDESVSIIREDGCLLYISNESTAGTFRVFSDSPFAIRPRSDNSIEIVPDKTAATRRLKKKMEKS